MQPKQYEEWYLQSDYDIEVAEAMLKSGRNIYCIFMCHLSLEKALKGLFTKRTGLAPSKLHNLIYFVDKIGLDLSDEDSNFIGILNKVSIPTRYPDDLRRLIKDYSENRTATILQQTKTLQQWIKQQ